MFGWIRLFLTLSFPIALSVMASQTQSSRGIVNAVASWVTLLLLFTRLHWAHFDRMIERVCVVGVVVLNVGMLVYNLVDLKRKTNEDERAITSVSLTWTLFVLILGIVVTMIPRMRYVPPPMGFFRLSDRK